MGQAQDPIELGGAGGGTSGGGSGATTSSGYAFGQGGSATAARMAGGGGGLWGGYTINPYTGSAGRRLRIHWRSYFMERGFPKNHSRTK